MRFLLLFPFLLSVVFAQSYDSTFTTVISLDGLNIRSTPSLKGWKLGAAPFGAELEILDQGNGEWETLGIRNYYIPGESEVLETPVTGTWVKVKYKEIVGYTFSAFLYRPWEKRDLKGVNQDYVLLYPGADCYDNLFNFEGMDFYGMYHTEGGSYLRAIKSPSFFVVEDELSPLRVSANNNKDLAFIIGSKKKLPVGKLEGAWLGRYLTRDNVFYDYEARTFREDFLAMHGLSVDWDGKSDLYQVPLFAVKDGVKTALRTDQVEMGEAMTLLWSGDLDGDGKRDYLIDFGEKVSHSILYLSSAAKPGELVRMVAVNFAGYCC